MFLHRGILSEDAKLSWNRLRATVSKEKAFQATVIIGELATEDMLDFSGRSPDEIDRIYVKLRDGMPMAAGMKKRLPHVDIRYIISQEKQGSGVKHPPISFWEGYDGYSNETLWFADPMNATGRTAIESLRFVRKYFKFNTALISHVAANIRGIKNMQATLDDFKTNGFMNYAYLSKKLDPVTGYMKDGLQLIPDFGDKVWGTLGEDYSVYDIQKNLKNLMGTEIGRVELLKGTILHLIQIADREEYKGDRTLSWMTKNWITSALKWYCAVGELPFEKIRAAQVSVLIEDLYDRGFISVEPRPWKTGYSYIYSLTNDGVKYTSCVYLPVLDELGIPRKLQEHFDFLIHLTPRKIDENIREQQFWM